MTDEERTPTPTVNALRVTRVEQGPSGVTVVAENSMTTVAVLRNGIIIGSPHRDGPNVRRIEYVVDTDDQPRVGDVIGVML